MIEGASGQKYDFVREYVLQPAGVTHTQIDDRLSIVPYRTRFYSKDAVRTGWLTFSLGAATAHIDRATMVRHNFSPYCG